jgi:hypothetical protein
LATQIQIKRGSTTPAGLTVGESAMNTSTNQIYLGGTGGTVLVGGEVTGGVDMGAGSAVSANRIPTQSGVYNYVRNSTVTSFNGLTGAVGGVCAAQANTFTALNTFNAGISAAGGVTFAGDIAVQGGDITTTSATATLYNTNATTVNIGNAASTVGVMGGTADARLNIGSMCYVKTGFKTTTSTAKQEIFRYASASSSVFVDTPFADIIITANRTIISNAPNNQITKMLVATSLTTTINHTEYGNVNTAGNLAVYTAELSGNDVIIYATPTTTAPTAFAIYATLIKGTYGFNFEE